MDIRKYFIVNNVEPVHVMKPTTSIKKSTPTKNPVFKNKIEEPVEKTDKKNKVYKVFTDGSSMNNGYKNCYGGIGVFFDDDSPYNISEKMTFKDDGKVSNNVCELNACLRAIQTIKDFKEYDNIEDIIMIYTDSKYVLDSITKWSQSWEKNGWMRKNRSGKSVPVKNVELMKQIKGLTRISNVQFRHVKAHRKEPIGIDKNSYEYIEWYGNMMADKLAGDGATSE
jgi:ribonuclease HI